MHYSIYALPSFISAVVMLFLFLYVFLYRRRSTGGWQFLGLMFTCLIWALGTTMSIIMEDEAQKIFWYNIAQIGPDFSPVFWLFLVLEHTGYKNIFQKKWLYSVFVLPIITTVLMWTNNSHHLLREAIIFNILKDSSVSIATLRGPWFYVEIGYAYLLLAFSFSMLFVFLKWSLFRTQTWVLILGFMPAIVSNILDIFNINPLQPLGATSIHFTLSGLILSWGLFHEGLLDITPIARDKVLEHIGDGVLVLDNGNRVTDANPAAQKLFEKSGGAADDLIGNQIQKFIPSWIDWCSQVLAEPDKKQQFTFHGDHENIFFSITLSSLHDKSDRLIGWIAIFHDITDEISTNNRLQDQLNEINQLQDRLREQALRDPLTNCFNRRYLEETLARESSRASRDDHTVGLVMMDIDHFKQCNDQFGHLQGDQVLQAIGTLLQKKVRLGDIVCRYGGEEFLIVFPGIDMSKLMKRARMLSEQISQLEITTTDGEIIPITVSTGVALYPEHGDEIEDVLSRADEALYIAKRAGRNTVYQWNPEKN